MAGHSKFKNIMYRKGAQDKKRANVFARLGREITVAAKAGGESPEANSRLRAAVAAARAENMPKDTIERAIKKGTASSSSENYESARYEGYGPAQAAVIIEALTDNRNRTASELRVLFSKFGGSLGESGSVLFLFDRLGEIQLMRPPTEPDSKKENENNRTDALANSWYDESWLLELALACGGDDVEFAPDEGHFIYCDPERLHQATDNIETHLAPKRGQVGEHGAGQIRRAALCWRPKTLIAVDGEQAETLVKFLDSLDDNDDVQHVFINAEPAPNSSQASSQA